ncbi:MAG: glycosyltransferase family 4 protein [Planctomycetes bacterium]|nr:glycosyltransferase family 4 protein [Planctomycetota bacterium]
MNHAPADDHTPPLHFRGVVLGPSGFAAQGREWLSLLDAIGLAPSLHGARLGALDGGETADERACITRAAARAPGRGRVTVHHVLPPHFAPDPGALADVVVTVFETTSLPQGWGGQLARAAALVVPAPEIAAAFVAGGVPEQRVHSIAPPVATAPFLRPATPWAALPPRRPGVRRLLTVGDWSLRKGFDVLLPAFARACRQDEAELIVKVVPRADLDRQELERHCRRVVQRCAAGPAPQVHVVDALLPADQLPQLYAACDALVLASRGEGWGRPVHEALLCGLPVVATDAGALATLLPDERVGFPVATRRAPVSAAAAHETPVFAGQQWWEPDPDDLTRQLQRCVRDPDEAAARGRRGREHVLALCEPQRVAAQFCRVLDAVARASSRPEVLSCR